MAVDASPASPSVPDKDGAPSSDGAMLGGQYVLSPKNVVAAFATRAAIAIEASDRRTAADPIVALICSGDTVPRIDTMAALRGLSKPGAMTLKDFGPVDWPDGRQRLAVIYSAPR